MIRSCPVGKYLLYGLGLFAFLLAVLAIFIPQPTTPWLLRLALVAAAGMALLWLMWKIHRTQQQLQKSEELALAQHQANLDIAGQVERYHSIFSAAPIGIYHTSKTGKILEANPALLEMLGYSTLDELNQSSVYDFFVHPQDREKELRLLEQQGVLYNYELQLLRSDRQPIWVSDNIRAIEKHGSEEVYYAGSLLDITPRKLAEQRLQELYDQLEERVLKRTEELRRALQRLDALRQTNLELASDLNLDTLLEAIVFRAIDLVGATASSLYLYRPEGNFLELTVSQGSNPLPVGSILHYGEGLSGKVWETRLPMIIPDYSTWKDRARQFDSFAARSVVSVPILWGENLLGVINLSSSQPDQFTKDTADLLTMFASQAAVALQNAHLYTETRRSQERLDFLAHHDPLTGLPNRIMFSKLLEGAFELGRQQPGYHFALLYIDLDHFKDINDTLGHPTGDQLLVAAARRFEHCLRDCDAIARMGGDEFAILVCEVQDEAMVHAIAHRLQAEFSTRFSIHDRRVQVSLSMGISLSSPAYTHPDEMVRDADIALYQAKEQGRARHVVFEREPDAR